MQHQSPPSDATQRTGADPGAPGCLPFNGNLQVAEDERERRLHTLRSIVPFVLDNSLRETNVATVMGHVLTDKLKILKELQDVGFRHIILGSFAKLKRVDDQLSELLRDSGYDMSHCYAFSELSDHLEDGLPSDEVPLGLQRMRLYHIPNTIIECDLACKAIAWDRLTEAAYCQLLLSRIQWARTKLSPQARVLVNLRDMPIAMGRPEARLRLLEVVDFLSSLPVAHRPTGLMFEDPSGAFLPFELGLWTAEVRSHMEAAGWSEGHLLVHVHNNYGLAQAAVLECLACGADGIWCAVCDEGAATGHAGSAVTLANLARLGNPHALLTFDVPKLREAAVNVTRYATGADPSPRAEVYGAQALDICFPANACISGPPDSTSTRPGTSRRTSRRSSISGKPVAHTDIDTPDTDATITTSSNSTTTPSTTPSTSSTHSTISVGSTGSTNSTITSMDSMGSTNSTSSTNNAPDLAPAGDGVHHPSGPPRTNSTSNDDSAAHVTSCGAKHKCPTDHHSMTSQVSDKNTAKLPEQAAAKPSSTPHRTNPFLLHNLTSSEDSSQAGTSTGKQTSISTSNDTSTRDTDTGISIDSTSTSTSTSLASTLGIAMSMIAALPHIPGQDQRQQHFSSTGDPTNNPCTSEADADLSTGPAAQLTEDASGASTYTQTTTTTSTNTRSPRSNTVVFNLTSSASITSHMLQILQKQWQRQKMSLPAKRHAKRPATHQQSATSSTNQEAVSFIANSSAVETEASSAIWGSEASETTAAVGGGVMGLTVAPADLIPSRASAAGVAAGAAGAALCGNGEGDNAGSILSAHIGSRSKGRLPLASAALEAAWASTPEDAIAAPEEVIASAEDVIALSKDATQAASVVAAAPGGPEQLAALFNVPPPVRISHLSSEQMFVDRLYQVYGPPPSGGAWTLGQGLAMKEQLHLDLLHGLKLDYNTHQGLADLLVRALGMPAPDPASAPALLSSDHQG